MSKPGLVVSKPDLVVVSRPDLVVVSKPDAGPSGSKPDLVVW